jgi:hypothetical protein
MTAMSPKHPRQSRRPVPADVEATNPSESAKALTVNVPIEILNRAKTRASLEGSTMSVVVSDALTAYADGLKDVLARLGLAR